VRPRYAGYVPFQSAAAAVVRDAVAGTLDHRRALARLEVLYREKERAA
jgi:multiple sugar transport system substrate-binding protein